MMPVQEQPKSKRKIFLTMKLNRIKKSFKNEIYILDVLDYYICI